MASADYVEHQAEYSKLAESNPRLSVREYCEDNGLNYNSARRYIRNAGKAIKRENDKKKARLRKKSNVKRGRNWKLIYFQYLSDAIECPSLTLVQFAAIQEIPVASIRREFAKFKRDPEFNDQCEKLKLAQIAHEEEKERARQNLKLLRTKNKVKTVRRTGSDHKQHDNQNLISDQSSDAKHKTAYRDTLGRFLVGNKFSLVHSGYVKMTELDEDIIETVIQIDPLNLANEIVSARSHYLSMQRFLAKERAAIIERYENDDPVLGFDGEPVSLMKCLGDLEYSSASKLRAAETSIMSLSATAARIQCDVAKIQITDHNTSVYSKQQELKYRQAIMTDAEDQGWSALKTAKEFERQGISIPTTVLTEMQHEIATTDPVFDDDGLTDDELDAICAEFEAKSRDFKDNELPARREQLTAMFDQQQQKEDGLFSYPPAEQQSDDVESEIDSNTSAFSDFSEFIDLDNK